MPRTSHAVDASNGVEEMPRTTLVAVLLVAASAVSVLAATARWGPVISWDSLAYLAYAGGQTSGSDFSGLFSPLFPLAITGIAKLGMSLQESARWLNAGLMGLATALAMLFAREARQTRGTVLLAGGLVLTSRVLLEQFVRVMSDPLALALGFLGLYGLARALARPGRLPLVLAAGAVGLALATRYASLPYLLTGIAMLVQSRAPSGRRRITDALLFTGVAALPLGAWMLRNLRATGQAVPRELAIHVPPADTIRAALHEISTWILPPRVPAPARLAALAAVAVAIGVLAARDLKSPAPVLRSPIALLLRRFLAITALFLLSVSLFVDASVTVSTRHWLPFYFALLLLGALLVGRSLAGLRGSRAGALLRGGAAGFLLLSGAITAAKAEQLRREGAEYGGRRLQSSVLRLLREPPQRNRLVYTENPEGLKFILGVEARRFPERFDPQTLQGNPRYEEQLERVIGELKSDRGLTVRFAATGGLERYPSPSELEGRGGLRLLAQDETAAIYQVP